MTPHSRPLRWLGTIGIGLVIPLALSHGTALANPIAYRISGSIIQADGVEGVRLGDDFTGFLAYATDLRPSDEPQAAGGRAYTGGVQFHFETSTRAFAILNPLTSAVFVEDIAPGSAVGISTPPGDNFGVLIAAGDTSPGTSRFLTFGLLDESGQVFSSTDLPMSLDFSRFDTGVVVAYDGHGGIVSGVIERLDPLSIPEPGSILIYVAAVVYFVFRIHRRS